MPMSPEELERRYYELHADVDRRVLEKTYDQHCTDTGVKFTEVNKSVSVLDGRLDMVEKEFDRRFRASVLFSLGALAFPFIVGIAIVIFSVLLNGQS